MLYPTSDVEGHGSPPDVECAPYVPTVTAVEPMSQALTHNSIVAVHGLNGSGRKTWTDSKTGIFWLEDLLPVSVPTARIMSFAYDSALAFSASTAGIENFARDLLNRLRVLRSGEVRFRSTDGCMLTCMNA